MFRKPKRKGIKDGLRRRKEDQEETLDGSDRVHGSGNEEEDGGATTADLIFEARKRLKSTTTTTTTTTTTPVTSINSSSGSRGSEEVESSKSMGAVAAADATMHTFETKEKSSISNSDLATRAALHLPSKEELAAERCRPVAGRGADGIYRIDAKQNKFLAGPMKASQNIRVTARFDYQPDICKDYKDTGFCGFGDTCIYLHDRGDTLTGWQLEAQWEEEQKRKKEKQEQELGEFMDAGKNKNIDQSDVSTTSLDTLDGLPFACHICREYFKDPIVTNCQHYFCQQCIMDHIRQATTARGGGGDMGTTSCPICHKDTHNVFHQPTKLLAKKRRVLGLQKSKEADSWKTFAQVLLNRSLRTDE